MARHPYVFYNRRKSRIRRLLYLITALLVAALAVVFIYRSYFSGRDRDSVGAVDLQEQKGNRLKPVLPEADTGAGKTDSRVEELSIEAAECINASPPKIIKARTLLNDALLLCQNERKMAFIKQQLSGLADEWLFSRTIFPQDKLCDTYTVKPSDRLAVIGKQFKVPWEILQQINGLERPESLKTGEIIKVINGPFHARIDRSQFTLDLYLQNTFVRSFQVGLGRQEHETPTGRWIVEPGGKLIKPTWTDPDTGKTYRADDSDYPLGSRWIGLKGLQGDAKGRQGFAIHGTKQPEQIGAAGSRGCIRLHNGDAILIYNLLMPGYSNVDVLE